MKRLSLTVVSLAIGVIVGAAGVLSAGPGRTQVPLPVSMRGTFPIVVSPDGRYLVTTNNDRANTVELHDFKTGRARLLTSIGVKQFCQCQMACYGVAFSPDSRNL